jgi:monoamine oxidase
MIDLAVVGAGLTGLTLTRQLQTMGVSVRLLDARTRAGGRILTDKLDQGAPVAPVDLGASWYWPDTEPRITQLVAELGLATFDQPDEGTILHLADPNRGPEPLAAPGIHGGARRMVGGMGTLVDVLQAQLAPDTLVLGHRLLALKDHGDHIELQLSHSQDGVEHLKTMKAKRVVLAMPPRLVAQHVRCQPALSDATLQAMNAVQTWMAREAKAIARFDKPFWLMAGQSGSGFVSHQQAALREVWDASDPQGAALAGFCAMPPETRVQFARSLPLLSGSQFAQLFGQEAHAQQQGDALVMDWSQDPWTASALDQQDTETLPPLADPLLRRPQWSGRLFFGGTETARQAPGHMEGALESAARLLDFLRPASSLAAPAPSATGQTPWQQFLQWVATERASSTGRYERHLKQMMSRQDHDRATQRALLAAAEQTYTLALEQLAQWSQGQLSATGAVTDGRSPLTPQVLEAFSGFSKDLVEHARAFNATSCALSNFADEHRLSADYLRAITADLAAAWREFAWSTNDLLCARQQAAVA